MKKIGRVLFVWLLALSLMVSVITPFSASAEELTSDPQTGESSQTLETDTSGDAEAAEQSEASEITESSESSENSEIPEESSEESSSAELEESESSSEESSAEESSKPEEESSKVEELETKDKEPETPTDGRILVVVNDGITVTAYTDDTSETKTETFYLPADAARRGIGVPYGTSVQYLTVSGDTASEPAIWYGEPTTYELASDTAKVIVSKAPMLRMRRAPSSSNKIWNGGHGWQYDNYGNKTTNGGNIATYFYSNFGSGVAYCGTVNADSPMGDVYHSYMTLGGMSEVTNQNIRKILYYGYKGPKQWNGFTSSIGFIPDNADISGVAATAYFATHDQLSKANSSIWRNCALSSNFESFWKSQPNAPAGFHVYVKKGSAGYQDMFVWEYQPTGGAKLVKSSSNPGLTNGNSCYSLAGAEYTVYSDKALTKKVGVLTTKADGTTNTLDKLNPGTYYYWETKAPKGFYANSGKTKSNPPSFKVESGKTTTIKESDIPGNDPFFIQIEKVSDDGSTADMSGAQFKLEFYDGYFDTADAAHRSGNLTRTWIIETQNKYGTCIAGLRKEYLVSGSSELYVGDNGQPTLPLGTLLVSESKAPGSGEYTAAGPFTTSTGETGDPYFVVQIKENPETGGFTHYTLNRKYTRGEELDLTKTEEHICGDFSFVKTTTAGKNLAGVSFELKQLATGTTYTLTTGADGSYSSKDDAALRKAFGATNEKECLPYGEYTLTELTGTANAGYELVKPVTFTISENDKVLDLGNITNYKPAITTKLMTSDQQKTVAVTDQKVTLTDVVTYSDFNNHTDGTYHLSGRLVDKDTGDTAKTGDGTELTVTEDVTFDASGSGDLTLNYPAFDPHDLEGKTLVSYVTITTKDGTELIKEEDLTNEDQTVSIPSMHTTAKDNNGRSGSDVVPVTDKTVTIVDTVVYSNLIKGNPYHLTATLMDKDTNQPIAGVTAEKDFTAADTAGSVDVEITVPASLVAGKTTVVFEDLKENGRTIYLHADISDHAQTVLFPAIHTTAQDKDGNLGKDMIEAKDEDVTIVDTVAYSSLKPETVYTVTGTLMDTATGEAFKGEDGKPVTASTTFNSGHAADGKVSVSGSVKVTFTVPADLIKGTKTVVFETLTDNGVMLAAHEDLTDEGQTVVVPEIHTTATDSETGDHTSSANEKVTIVDRVYYSHLLAGKQYTVSGKLMDKATGEALTAGGKEVTATTTFTAAKSEGYIDLTFTFDGSALKGQTIVAFETVQYKSKDVAVHADLNDEEETIHFPEIHTTLTDSKTEDHVAKAEETVTLKDTVAYSNLVPGKEYTMTGTLMVKETGEALQDNGENVTATATFTAEEADGTVELTFTFNGKDLAGQSVVAFETMTHNGKEVAVHADIDDEGQTVNFPDIHTTAADFETEDHISNADEDVTIIDRVAYTNLLVGKEYTVTGTLMDKETEKPITVDGKEVTASTTFTAEQADGTVDVTFTFDGSALEGKTVVAFESTTYEGKEVAVHADINDEDQTVEFPKVHTTATDSETKDHTSFPDEKVTINDRVYYSNLLVGKEYTVSGKLMLKGTGKALTDNGKEVTATAAFTAEKSEGYVDLTFTFNGSALAGESVVAFEDVQYKGKDVAVHADLSDKDQTVDFPSIHTSATANGAKEVYDTDGTITITDVITYTNLTPGTEYRIEADVINSKDGSSVGKAAATFTAQTADGTASIDIQVNVKGRAGQKLTVFEEVYEASSNVKIGEHKDLNDNDQTITVKEKPGTFFPKIPKTGDTQRTALYGVILLAAAAAAILVIVKRRKETQRDE